MEGYDYFFKKTFWGFRIPRSGSRDVYLAEYSSKWVEALIDASQLLNWEYEFLTKIHTPCIYIKTPDTIHHYFLNEDDALIFRDDIMGISEDHEDLEEKPHSGFSTFI